MKTNRLLESQVIHTYASLLLEAAEGEGRVVEDLKELGIANKIIQEFPQLQEALGTKLIPSENRNALVNDIFEGSLSPEVKSVVAIMAERLDTDYLDMVAEEYQRLAEEKLNLVIADVTTAVAMDDDLRQVVSQKLQQQFGKKVYIEEHVDPSIIGGVIVNAQGKRMDASIATQLAHAKNVLSKNVSVGGDA
ncbi:MAG: ATP synthase F1 subunit delta [Coriobacteriia bacterium]|nr:ATP synthase F1 subunit delta [Coriobacteriia bacterium]